MSCKDWVPEPAMEYAKQNLSVLCKELQHMMQDGRAGPHMAELQGMCYNAPNMPCIRMAMEFVHDAAVKYIAGLHR